MSTVRISAFILFSASLYAQTFGPLNRHAAIDYDSMPLFSASGDHVLGANPDPLLEPSSSDPKPITGVVSVHELQHPVPNKALLETWEAQQLVRANKVAKAIAKLEHAVRIAPEYRDAHWNLGALYARVGRLADAQPQFKKALEIGPPAAGIYTNLALTSLTQGQTKDAEIYAQKALDLEPGNELAKRLHEGHVTN